jgi:predicted transglutaminase-like protease
MLVRIYKNSNIAKNLDINAPPRFIKCYQGDIIKNPTYSEFCNNMKIDFFSSDPTLKKDVGVLRWDEISSS